MRLFTHKVWTLWVRIKPWKGLSPLKEERKWKETKKKKKTYHKQTLMIPIVTPNFIKKIKSRAFLTKKIPHPNNLISKFKAKSTPQHSSLTTSDLHLGLELGLGPMSKSYRQWLEIGLEFIGECQSRRHEKGGWSRG